MEKDTFGLKTNTYTSVNRRQLFKTSLVISSGLAAGRSFSTTDSAPEPDRMIGQPATDLNYGNPSPHADAFRKLLPGNGYTGSSYSPLSKVQGALTPSGLHFERHHGGVADINPENHRLYVKNKRNRKFFSMVDLMRFPQRTLPAFIECSGNSDDCWKDSPEFATVDEIHGMTSQSFWTGVPFSWILKEMQAPREKAWVIAVGKDAPSLARSIPVEKCWENGLIAYGQNGEALRPEQGFPLRLILPGWEGNCQVKWLSRLELSDRPAFSYQETAKYSDLYRDGKSRLFTFAMDTKSVITTPSGGMQLADKGFHEIRGLAWSGKGLIKKVEISTDGGRSWLDAELEEPVLPFSHTRFYFPWWWDGAEAVLQSRATDSTGYRQPERKALISARGKHSYYHYHGIQSWWVDRQGSVKNYHV